MAKPLTSRKAPQSKGDASAFDLTLDNPHLSRPTNGVSGASPITPIDLPEAVSDLVRDSLAKNTKRAYLSDLRHFECWGGSIPATELMIAEFLAAYAETLSVATLTRRLASINKAHRARGLAGWSGSALIAGSLRGIKKRRGSSQRQAKPLLREDLFIVLSAMGDNLKAVRDRALLLVGFAGGFRRSELIEIDCKNVDRTQQGIAITIPRSKTDQEGRGRKIGIPFGRTRWCPVTALEEWLKMGGVDGGPLFRRVDRHGNCLAQRMSGEAVSLVIKERVEAAGLDPSDYSGHSLRSGFCTSAAQAGIASWIIRKQTGHASDVSMARYVRDGSLFINNAANTLL